MLLYETFLTSSQANILASGSAFTAFENSATTAYNEGSVIKFTEEVLDEGNNYDPATSKYTCPVTGNYLFR